MRTRVLAVVTLVAAVPCLAQNRTPLTVQIKVPASNARVGWRDTISGAVSDPQARVWVVLHQAGTTSFYVQAPVTVESNGHWSLVPYIGLERDTSQYEIRVFANPRDSVGPGELGRWPTAEAMSEVVRVRRRPTR